jgi:hypothetical protein
MKTGLSPHLLATRAGIFNARKPANESQQMIASNRAGCNRQSAAALLIAVVTCLAIATPGGAQPAATLDALDPIIVTMFNVAAVMPSGAREHVDFRLRADRFTRRGSGEWSASGVQIRHGARTVDADEIVYTKREKAILAIGVLLRSEDGPMIRAERYHLSGELHQALTRLFGGD